MVCNPSSKENLNEYSSSNFILLIRFKYHEFFEIEIT